MLGELRGATPAAEALLRSAEAILRADTSRALTALRRIALDRLGDEEAGYVADSLVTILANRGELEAAESVLEQVESRARPDVAPALDGWRAYIDVRRERRETARKRFHALREVHLSDPLLAGRLKNRLALVAYHLGEVDDAEDLALAAARLYETNGAFRLASHAYSLPYVIAKDGRGDLQLGRYFAERIAVTARRAGDEGMYYVSLVSQLEISAETADRRRYGMLLARLLANPRSTQYAERFPERIARALATVWSGTLQEFMRAVDALVPSEPADRALVFGLQAVAAASEWRDRDAVRLATKAVGLIAQRREAAPHDASRRRVARALAAAALALAGVGSRAQRIASTTDLRGRPESSLAAFAIGRLDLASVEPGVRGYALVVDACRRARDARDSSVLTRREQLVLRMYAQYGTAGAVRDELRLKSTRTVHWHLENVRRKLGVTRTVLAVRAARERGLIA